MGGYEHNDEPRQSHARSPAKFRGDSDSPRPIDQSARLLGWVETNQADKSGASRDGGDGPSSRATRRLLAPVFPSARAMYLLEPSKSRTSVRCGERKGFQKDGWKL
ncbi:uncharacterized protein TRIVIDRAFT_221218 [Trichoderma virens Gv29-8]|uniref:Uncharacterized protein n=1 Tax=Hypocrea virens (strain Gv29-8 / FGSC 10586) TaxID=413071 RepID=G9MQ23_HYPVG|nr:uncharacterized protein TRIVIDRAFT_221218 [Trichoderma virens Gv29-8]EHK23972.1 hypothetical protein TRIVIDRAFT_221218 [Trichoderma virens Gv29-8]UKZ50278.1 hypothetical protein TrVGV298_004535 [Trichoderma virens]